jgi:hypothetical protein
MCGSTTLWNMDHWSNVCRQKYTIVKNVEQQINKYYHVVEIGIHISS